MVTSSFSGVLLQVMYVLDEPSIILLSAAPALLVTFVFIVLYKWYFPKLARSAVAAKFKKCSLEIESGDDGIVRGIAAKMGSEGQLYNEEERFGERMFGMKSVPLHSHPAITHKFFTPEGIPVFFSYAGKAVATNPLIPAMAAIYDQAIDTYRNQITSLIIQQQGRQALFEQDGTTPKKLVIDPRSALQTYFTRTLSEGQVQVMMEKRFLKGREIERRGGFNTKRILIVIAIMAIVFLVIMCLPFIEQFFGGLTLPI